MESIKHKEAMLDCQTCANYKNECFPDKNIFKCSPIKYSENTQDVEEKQCEQEYTNSKENDERLRKTTIAFLKDFAEQGYENAVECIDWLEKQGDKSHWKPTEEQLQTLHAQLNEGAVTYPDDKRVLTTLYEDLTK